MENPISYSDLFSPDLQNDINGLIGKVKELEKSLTDMIATVKTQAKGLGESLSVTSSSTKGGRESSKTQAQDVEKLYAAYQQLGTAQDYIRQNLEKLLATQTQMTKAHKLAEQAANSEMDSISRLRAQIELAKMALAGMSGDERKTSEEGQRLSTVIRTLDGQIKNYEKSLKATATATKASTSSAKESKKEIMGLWDAYSSLSDLLDKTQVNLYEVVKSQKAQEQASKNGKIANESLSGSYNQLYAQYNLIKIALNNMSKEMRDNVNVGKVFEAEALRIMNEMKAMQEATGKSTLSVGDYGKALNGLNISTQQVLREMPTLANSVSQFFIAISNNVPIFVDNFKRAQAELGGFTKAVGATLKAVMSWQTVLLVILTVLPKVAKAIHDKKKAQEEANKETEKALTLEQMLVKAYTDVAKSEAQEATQLEFLIKVSADHNRSMEDRIKAAQVLKQEYKETLENYSEEAIVAGEAKTALDNLTASVREHAKARAMMNKMVEAYENILENQSKIDEAQLAYETAKAQTTAAKAAEERVRQMSNMGEAYGKYADQTAKAEKAEQAALETLQQAQGETAKFQQVIDDLYKNLPIEGLIEDLTEPAGPKTREKIMQLPEYYNEALRALIEGMEDGLQKEIALLDLEYKIAVEKRHEQEQAILEMMTQAKESQRKILQDELSNLRFTMSAEESNYYQTRERMMREHILAMTQVEVEMNDPEQEALDNLKNTLKVEKRYRDLQAAMAFDANMQILRSKEHAAYDEIALKDDLNAQLLASERKYWEDYLVMLKSAGLELTDEYMEVVNKLASYASSPNGQTSTRKKRGSKNFSNLTEVAFAFNGKTGEKTGPGFFNRKIKDEYMDFADAINNALQTSIDYMNEWMDKRIEMAEIAVEQAEKEANAAKTALDYEQQARANGYANNVELARKEYEEKLALQQQAVAEQKRLQKIQDSINTAQQISSLVTATANLWSAYSGIPVAGPALAIAATALMWGSFMAAKIQAAQVAGTVTHGEGMVEYLNYGGSHASGNDIDFGHTRDGRRRRVERGEVVGVIRKDSVEKYGANTVLNIIKAINGGTFERNYTSINSDNSTKSAANIITSTELMNMIYGDTNSVANSASTQEKLTRIINNSSVARSYAYGALPGLKKAVEANYAMAFSGGETDLSSIERGLRELIEQNGTRIVQTPYGRIEYRGNTKRIIKDA